MKKKITITESELHNIVEGIISELDWKTYMNANRKGMSRANGNSNDEFRRALDFSSAAEDAFPNKYKEGEVSLTPRGYMIEYPPKDMESWNEGDDMPEYIFSSYEQGNDRDLCAWLPYNRKKGTKVFKETGKKMRDDFAKSHPEITELDNYYNGNYGYVPGEGWKLKETFVRDVTEAVIRELKRKK